MITFATPVDFSLTVHRSIKNIPWLKVLILRMVPYPSSVLKLILVKNISLFVSPYGVSLLDGFPRFTVNSSIRRFWQPEPTVFDQKVVTLSLNSKHFTGRFATPPIILL